MLQVTAAAFDVGVSLDTAGAVYYLVTTPTTTATSIASAASSVQPGGSLLAQGTLLSPSDVPSSVAVITSSGSSSSSTSTTPATNVTIQGVADSVLVNNPSRRRQLRQQAGPWQETTRALSDWHADTLRDWGLPGKFSGGSKVVVQLSKLMTDLYFLQTHASRQAQGRGASPPVSSCHTTACLLSNWSKHSAVAAQQNDGQPALSACTSKQAGTWQEVFSVVCRGLSSDLVPEVVVCCAPHIVHSRAALQAWRKRTSDAVQ